MTTTTTTPTQPTRRGFRAPCIKCGGEDGGVMVILADTSRFHCDQCDSDFTTNDVRLLLAAWRRVLDWCETAPVVR